MHIGSIERIWLQRLISGATSISITARQASRGSKRWRQNKRCMRNSLSRRAPWSDGCGRYATQCRTLAGHAHPMPAPRTHTDRKHGT